MPRITNVPKNKKNTKKSKFQPTTLDNYTNRRGKEIGPSLRGLLPKKSDLVDRNGRLKVSKETVEDLFAAIDRLMQKGVVKDRDAKGRFRKGSELGIDKMLEAMATDKHLSAQERVKAATLRIYRKTIDEGAVRQAQNIAKSSGAIRNKDWYSAKHFVEDLGDNGDVLLDVERLTEPQKDQIRKGIEDGTMDVGSLPEPLLKELMDELYDNTSDWDDTKDDYGKHGQLLEVRPQMREKEMAGIDTLIRRFL